MPQVSLRPASRDERSTLESLLQLYAYDWSELVPLDVGADGRFAAPSLEPYFQGETSHAMLVRVGETIAGFALVLSRSRLTGTRGVFDMAEFFVMRRFRRQGIGRAAALMTFLRFKGPWEVRQRDENPGATAFWRSAIAEHTAGAFEEVRVDTPEWRGTVQRFVSA